MPDPTIGFSSKFGITNGAGGFTDVAHIISINGPSRSRTAVNATNMQSPNGYEEFIAGMRNGGTVNVTLGYYPATSDAIVTAFDAGKQDYQITAPNGIRLQFTAIMTSDSPEMPLDDRMTRSCDLQISGKPSILASL